MDRTNYQTNVGLFTLIALILLLYGWSWLKSFSLFTQPQRFTAQFSDVAGLSKNATVNIQGVRVGTVEYMEFVNDPQHPEHNAKINVHIKITDSTVLVPEGSHISIQTLGLVGAKYIEIALPRDAAGNVIKGRPLGPNDIVQPPYVEEPVRVELVMNRVATRIDDIVSSIDTQQASKAFNNLSQATAKLNKNMDKFKAAAESVQEASANISTTANKFGKTADTANVATERAATFFKTGDETLHSIDETSVEFRGTAKRVNKLLENPNLTGDLKEAIAEARKTAETIRGAMGDLETTLQDKQLRAQVLDLLTHLEKSTENIKSSLETVQKLSGDQGLRSDLKDIVHNAKEAIQEADAMLSQPDFKSNICATLNKVRSAADNIDVAARQVQQVLDKRAPLLQMLFRRPGKKPPHTPDNPNCAPMSKTPKVLKVPVLVPVPVQQAPVTAPAPGSP